jgi:hypothetical protein
VLSVVDSDRHDGGAPHEGGALDDAGVPDGGGAVDDSVAPKRTWWWQRRTLRQIKRDEAPQCSDYTDQWDARENDETRLPENEVVHLGGVTLVEAFTPSTVSKLYNTLSNWQPQSATRPDHDLVADLERSRSGAGGGWTNLGPVRPQGGNLPPGVQAVWLNLSYLLPSVAVVCATFTFENDMADISDLLKADFVTTFEDVRVVVHGRFGRLRSRIPWSRPRYHGMSSQMCGACG